MGVKLRTSFRDSNGVDRPASCDAGGGRAAPDGHGSLEAPRQATMSVESRPIGVDELDLP